MMSPEQVRNQAQDHLPSDLAGMTRKVSIQPLRLDGTNPATIPGSGRLDPRSDFSGEEELRDSIIENGVAVSLRVRRGRGNKIFVVDGERRLRATLRAMAEGNEVKTLPGEFVRPGISEIEAIVLALLTNHGKPLDRVEEAEALRRLKGWVLSAPEITRRIGKSSEIVRRRRT